MKRKRKGAKRAERRSPLNVAHGARLRALRLARDLSIQDVSDATGIRKPGISMMERGLQEITLSHLDKLLRALDATWADFGVSPAGEEDEEPEFKAAG